MDSITLGEMVARIGSALALGALVGLERERKHRPAGFRTMILVSMGSAAFMLIGAELVAKGDRSAIGQAELSRALQGLIGGIGFLGAGAVIQSKRAVRGMTTAAAIWVTAAIGAACGLGFHTLAAVVAVGTLFTLVVLELIEDRYFPDQESSPDDWDAEKKWNKAKQNGNGHSPPAAQDASAASGGLDRLRGDGA